MNIFKFFLIVSLFLFLVCNGSEVFSTQTEEKLLEQVLLHAHIPKYRFQVVHTYPHDNHSYTEGLLWENAYVYESTGLYGQSKLRQIELKTGKILKEHIIPSKVFAEGLTTIGDQLYQLTYHEHTGYIYDKKSFQLKNTFSYDGEGWGLTTDEQHLIMSNGSEKLIFIDPKTFKPIRALTVTVKDYRVASLNALAYVHGKIYANVWPTSLILVISPQNGKIEGWMNIKALKPASSCMECVANGIAYHAKDNLLLVTGKNWPSLYAIRIDTTYHPAIASPLNSSRAF